ncbi:MAG: hypothetical protein MK052_08995 [Alphaproteobacteria bacterium]|nr:hypothetical protein [Alphaproteobacteria bacterium]
MFCAFNVKPKKIAVSALLLLAVGVAGVTMTPPANAQDNYATSRTHVFNMADELNKVVPKAKKARQLPAGVRPVEEAPALEDDAPIAEDETLVIGVDAALKDTEREVQADAALETDIGDGGEVKALVDADKVDADLAVEQEVVVEKKTPSRTLTAREKIYEKIRQNRMRDN